jgi:hypothetical protein
VKSVGPRLALCALLLSLPPGCGYSVVRYRGAIPGAGTLAIRALENETLEPGVEAVVADALRAEAVRRGDLRLVEDPEAADLVFSGAVQHLNVSPRSFSSVALALEYVVRMQLDLRVEHRDGTVIALDPRALADTETYLASADVEATRKNRRESIHRLARLLADRIYDSLYETAAR